MFRADRPPADDLINEFIFDKKCAKGENFTKFFNWCRFGRGDIETVCYGLSGTNSPCFLYLLFDAPGNYDYDYCGGAKPGGRAFGVILNQANQNSTETPQSIINGSSTVNPVINTTDPVIEEITPFNLYYKRVCFLGVPCTGDHDEIQYSTIPLSLERAKEIDSFCEYQINPVIGMPWWLILLIVALTIGAVAGAFALFWKYWLRRRIYGRQKGEKSSLGSAFTSAPISSATDMPSMKPNVAPSGQSEQSGIRVFPGPMSSNNLRSVPRPLSKKPLSMRPGSTASTTPSTRSNLSGTRSRSVSRRRKL